MSDLQELKNELMKDPEFKKEYESLQPEMDITRAILDARIQAGLTQIQTCALPIWILQGQYLTQGFKLA